MKFTDINNGREYSLHSIPGTDYRFDLDGDLYHVDEQTGTCYQVSGLEALRSILRRGNVKNGYCPICDDMCLKTSAEKSQRFGYEKYFEK